MKHVSKEALDNDLPIRIAYLRDFIEFTEEDVKALSAAAPYAKAAIPEMIDAVCTFKPVACGQLAANAV